jgi:hypothetical protein
MENLKKNPLSLQLNVEDFAPASNDEKKSLVVMRESVNFWKDGMRRSAQKQDRHGQPGRHPADRLHGLCSAQLLALQL